MKGERAVVRGAIDGCLSVLGVVIGAYGVDSSWLLSAALAGNLANGMSNLTAAFSAESARHAARLRDLERSMLTELGGTEPARTARTLALREAMLDGAATLAGGLVPVAPFLLFTGLPAISLSIVASLCVMLALGAWTGRSYRESMLLWAVKLALLGILTTLACLLIHHLMAPITS